MFASIDHVLPIVIANNAAQHSGTTSEAGMIGAGIGLAILAIVALIFAGIAVKWTVLDIIDRHKNKAAYAAWDAVYAAKAAKREENARELREMMLNRQK